MEYSEIYSAIALDNKTLSKEQFENAGWFDAPMYQKIAYESFNGFGSVKTFEFVDFGDFTYGYFPGAFTIFHDGHVEVIRQFLKSVPDPFVVIAPANTDYLVTKYGKYNPYIDNKGRYDRIVKSIKKNFPNDLDKICIDLSPMLNHETDFNFTDLFNDFLTRMTGHSIYFQKYVPYILTGKDREYFKNLETLQKETFGGTALKIFYVDSYKDLSSKNLMDSSISYKKNLLLRVNNMYEYELFRSYFGGEYNHINVSFIQDEQKRVRDIVSEIVQYRSGNRRVVTNCKEYANILPYYKCHRLFNNPLEEFGYYGDMNLKDCHVIDSDSYSGGTKRFLEGMGCVVTVLYDFEFHTDTDELLDIDDFRKDDFCYPFVDISSRCSMIPFDRNDHIRYNEFKSKLKEIAK